jgi:hypothetical protein
MNPDPRDPIAWDRIFRTLCRRYKWTPDTVWALTLPEVRLFMVDDEARSRTNTPNRMQAGPFVPLGTAFATLNESRAKRGLPPLEMRVLKGIDPKARK